MMTSKCCPNAPIEPPDMPKGTRGWGVELRAETRTLGMSRGAEQDVGSNGNKEHQARKPDEPSGRPQDEVQDCTEVQVDPGKCATHKNMDVTDNRETTVADRKATGTAQVKGESTRTLRIMSITGESKYVSRHIHTIDMS